MYPGGDEDRLAVNVHENLKPPTESGKSYLVRGSYTYYHYGCDGVSDEGWGCGYRTCQTLCSWVRGQQSGQHAPPVPSIRDIQDVLVRLGDKPPHFAGSRDWIGSVEVCLVLDQLYAVPCRILHSPHGTLGQQAGALAAHFRDRGSPVMMGGDLDCSSKGVLGAHVSGDHTYLLVVDPHFSGRAGAAAELVSAGWVKWQRLSQFQDSSFYNLCLPQLGGRE
ncbi:ufm1-specific protease 1 [Bacillus rossius redtenbacheri]|uniref:ufm1-specific protease 1 n=1 Tax=Bacillus rossius redtenbacheri TaxID=93214 RepID=UPI002FDCD95C